jgi:hypothetical protein
MSSLKPGDWWSVVGLKPQLDTACSEIVLDLVGNKIGLRVE